MSCLVKNLEHMESVCEDNVEELAQRELLNEPVKFTFDTAQAFPEIKNSTPNDQLPNNEFSICKGHGNQRRKYKKKQKQ